MIRQYLQYVGTYNVNMLLKKNIDYYYHVEHVAPGPVVVGGHAVQVETHLAQHHHIPPAVHLTHS